jgi:hypothetical protein
MNDDKRTTLKLVKPKVKLIDGSGNAFVILAECRLAARRAGWTIRQIDDVMTEMKRGDYNHLLQTAMEYFDVDGDADDDPRTPESH